MKLIVVFLLATLTTPSVSSSDISKLQSEVQTLSQKLLQQGQKINQLEFLKTKDAVRNRYCQIKSDSCGSCFCVEDFNLIEKFYCDCRARPIRRDCKEHYTNGEKTSGLYMINTNTKDKSVPVYCDHDSDGGGWTVVQRRVDGSTDFNRDWKSYRIGFGELQREFWLGNDNLFHLTAQAYLKSSTVRFDLVRRSDSYKSWAKYSKFSVGDEWVEYKLHIAGYSGNAGDNMKIHDGMKFSTYDNDNDADSRNCAVLYKAPWWHQSCYGASLNGAYDALLNESNKFNRIYWAGQLKYSEMKVRRN
ncbi:ficolin-2-like [Clytia hemisphaerica]|uniref:Fibrinogen C-terminal domain-containing protein n=1 Tax=Clytia hemisphaerica TaxID=252671 RepID=A0A7M5XF68_9CNID